MACRSNARNVTLSNCPQRKLSLSLHIMEIIEIIACDTELSRITCEILFLTLPPPEYIQNTWYIAKNILYLCVLKTILVKIFVLNF